MKLNRRFRNTIGAVALSLAIFFSSMAGATPATYAASPITVGGKALITNTDGNNIRVRDGAGVKYDQIAEAHQGEVAAVLAGPSKDSNGNIWYKVQVPNGSGWILSDFLQGKGGSSGSSSPTANAITAGGKALVTNTDGNNIRVRNGAGTKYDQVAEAHQGEVASVVAGPSKDSNGNTWYKVQVPNGSGWILSDFLQGKGGSSGDSAPSTQTSNAQPAKSSAPTSKLNGFAQVANTEGDYLRIRSDPSRKGSVLTTISPDATMAVKKGPVVDSNNIAWYQVTSGGVTGWAMGQYLAQAQAPAQAAVKTQPSAPAPVAAKPAQAPVQAQVKAPAPVVAKPAAADTRSGVARGAQPPAEIKSSSIGSTIVNVAMRYLGYRYVFGGASPRGFDCSGFICYVVNKSGKGISRDMYAQLNSGSRVSSSDLQPGDLLFFSNTYKRGLSHAGIYIGNGKFIHAENESTGVTISAVWSAYWAAHYTAAVRLR